MTITQNYEPQSPWSSKELILRNDAVWFREIIDFEKSKPKSYSMAGLAWSISNAIKENKAWGYSFCNYLIKHKNLDSDLFPSLLIAFQEWPEALEDSNQIRLILSEEYLQKKYPKELSEILLGAVKKGGVSYLSQITEQLNSIAQLIWKNLNVVSCAPFDNTERDFYSAAINTAEGNLATYWLSALYYQLKTQTNAVFDTYKTILTELCTINDPKSIYTIPVICSELNYLFSIDENWSTNTIVPIFFNNDNQRRIHAWHGFLYSSGPSSVVFAALSDSILGILPKVHEILSAKIDRFLEFYVAIIFWYISDPNELWIPKLFDVLKEQERRVFTERIGYFLQNLSKDNINSNWDTWLKLYWQNRIKDIPKKLTDSEMQSMLNWLPYLGEKFTDGVEIAIKMRRFELNISGSFLHLDDLPKKYPEATAKLLIYLLECSLPHFFLHNLDEILRELGASEISDEISYALNQSLIRSGKGEITNKNT